MLVSLSNPDHLLKELVWITRETKFQWRLDFFHDGRKYVSMTAASILQFNFVGQGKECIPEHATVFRQFDHTFCTACHTGRFSLYQYMGMWSNTNMKTKTICFCTPTLTRRPRSWPPWSRSFCKVFAPFSRSFSSFWNFLGCILDSRAHGVYYYGTTRKMGCTIFGVYYFRGVPLGFDIRPVWIRKVINI